MPSGLAKGEDSAKVGPSRLATIRNKKRSEIWFQLLRGMLGAGFLAVLLLGGLYVFSLWGTKVDDARRAELEITIRKMLASGQLSSESGEFKISSRHGPPPYFLLVGVQGKMKPRYLITPYRERHQPEMWRFVDVVTRRETYALRRTGKN
jgi:hypothetical protein